MTVPANYGTEYSLQYLYVRFKYVSIFETVHGVDIEMIDLDIPVQITQQGNHSNAKHYHKKTHETPSTLNYC